MISFVKDLTSTFNSNGAIVFDIGAWNYITLQTVTNSATLSFYVTNDGGAIEGSTSDEPDTAANFFAFLGTNLTAGTTATTLSNGSGATFSFPSGVKYLKVSGGGTVTKMILHLSKIS